ncbi:hypothetical protein DSO57_1031209 [Entomophthora muscae]|uniref:Uncharacterized protein n=2 Tax=Entomophthora muscae TaxID=34485 RepID=A0ACC2T9W3_9FUNG|nr:hypothetical protein DSO57_1037696 [Entomophthora muscae]KAJ9087632.1 hypothetical protein DSO57_1031209 [Entomophthora muscae]
MTITSLCYGGYAPDAFHKKVGIVGKGPHEKNVIKLKTKQTKVIKLSPLDYPEAFIWTPLLIPFENINHEEEFMPDDRLIASLKHVIERVPIITGKLERVDGTPMNLDGPNSPLQVCVGRSSVWYASTNISGSFQDFKASGFSYETMDPDFLFRAANDAIIQGQEYPLFTAKVSRFDCGSILLLVTTCHLIVDARSTYELLKTWSMIYCGIPDAPLIKESRHLFSYDDELNERSKLLYNELEKPASPSSPPPNKLIKLVYASIDDTKFKAFKERINAEIAPAWVSSDDVMLGLGWRAFTRARQLNPTDTTTLVRIADVRKLNQPSLPPTAFGNGCMGTATSPLSVKTLLESPLSQICQLVRASLARINAETVRDTLTARSKLPAVSHPLGGTSIAFSTNAFSTSYASFDPTQIDFQNSPALTVTRACYTEGVITPQPIVNNIYSCKLAIDSTHAQDFIRDPDLTKAGFTLKL